MTQSKPSTMNRWANVMPSAFSLGQAVMLGLTCLLTSFSGSASAQTSAVSVTTLPVRQAVIAQPVSAYGAVSASGAAVQSITLPYTVRVATLRIAPGQRVTKGTPLMDVVADATATLARDQASTSLSTARRDLTHTKALYDAHLATQSQLDAAQKTLDDATQADAVQQRVGATNGTQTLRAPFDGVVVQVNAGQGDQVSAGTALGLLARDGQRAQVPNVVLSVEPSRAGSIRPGDVVVVRAVAANLSGQTVSGKVATIGAAIDPVTQAVVVTAMVPDSPSLIPGTRVSASIQTQPAQHWVVPRSAVLRDKDGAYLYQVDGLHRAHRIAVRPKVDAGDKYGVDGELLKGAPVVVAGNYELTEGMAVTIAGGN
ncbi:MULTISPECIES: efflux RND transporter periplasmic adaptor subunit [Pandoraea]|nr:efflux RND transporter periplasmic adaptor subunit [Pandoraea cepalis]